MELVAQDVGVDGAHGVLLAPTSLRARPGEVTVVTGMPGAGHTALALVLGGRMRPDRGRVLLDGDERPRARRRAVAVVDTPGVSEPDGVLSLRTVVGEELAMARHRAGPRSVSAWLAARELTTYAGTRFEEVAPAVRIAVMTELAASRPGVELLVVTLPDRHGAPPAQWWAPLARAAADGAAVVVTCTDASAALLDPGPGAAPARIGGGDLFGGGIDPATAGLEGAPEGRHEKHDPTTEIGEAP